MELLVLDTEFKATAIVDFFKSVIWTDRYNKYGDIEITSPVTNEYFNYLKHDYYIYNSNSEHVMIIDSVEIKTDIEMGNLLIIKGKSLESILNRRIVWVQTVLTGNFQNEIKKLLDEAIINPIDQNRKIENFIFEESDDPIITELKMDSAQYTGDNLYEVISNLCQTYNIGFKITLNNDNQFVFKLYAGHNRSYDQEENPYVVFSPSFENIINSNYYENKEEYKTITLVAGEGEGSARKTTTVSVTEDTGLMRRELYTDARDISSDAGGDYYAQLQQRGKEKLEENKINKAYDGQVETSQLFIFGLDYFMGDQVQLMNEYGLESKSRVIEMIMSCDDDGELTYPSFEIIDKTNEEENK